MKIAPRYSLNDIILVFLFYPCEVETTITFISSLGSSKTTPDLDHSIMLKSLSSFSDKSDSSKTVPFGVIHTYIAY